MGFRVTCELQPSRTIEQTNSDKGKSQMISISLVVHLVHHSGQNVECCLRTKSKIRSKGFARSAKLVK